MNSAINYYTAAQRNADAVREARRARPLRPIAEPAERRSLVAVVTRRLIRPRALRAAFGRR